MHSIQKKYSYHSFAGKTILFFSLLISSLLLKAQGGDGTRIDSVKKVIEKSAATEQDAEINIETDNKKYFLKKWETENDSFTVRQRSLPDSLVKKMQAEDAFWYANAEFKKENRKKQKESSYVPLARRSWFQTLLWLIIIGSFAGFIMWWLAGSNVGLFRKKNRIISDDGEDPDTDDIFAINYQKEIDRAANQGNYRLAIRLMFLQLLKTMSEKDIIQYKQGRTNLDFLGQLIATRYYPDFFRITRNYEYSWYGRFEVTKEAYTFIRNNFNNFTRQLN